MGDQESGNFLGAEATDEVRRVINQGRKCTLRSPRLGSQGILAQVS
jgi:hypothetical protein